MSEKSQEKKFAADKNFLNRLKQVIAESGLNQLQFAAASEMSSSYLSEILSGKRTPSVAKVRSICLAFSIRADWLLYGFGERNGVVKSRRGKCACQPIAEQFSYIPLYEIKACAGGGAIVEHENAIDMLAFKTEWIYNQINSTPDSLYLIRVQGESMDPTLRQDDIILVDHSYANAMPRDGIYVLQMDHTLMIKRLQRLPGGEVRVTSDNPAYEPFTIRLDDPANDITIIGRVVWCARKF